MDLNAQIGVVSIFGRGHWLAAKLAEDKIPVTLLDVSDQMGLWQPEDIEGPFGYFPNEGLAKERLSEDEKALKMPSGFTIWLPDGPVELQGPTALHRLQQIQTPEISLEYLKKSPTPNSAVANKLKKLPFDQNWLSQLSHNLSCSIDTLSTESLKEGMKRNLFEDFYVRQVTVNGHSKSLNWCEQKGVKVLRNVEIKDLVFYEINKIASLEVRTDHLGIFKAEQLVVCLTAEECAMISPKIQQSLFGQGVIEPQWAWMRYRVKMQGEGPLSNLTRDQIPVHCVVIDDLMLPWSHENLMIVQRASQPDSFDVWMKMPNNQRFNSQYLIARGEKMMQALERRLPDNHIVMLALPLEAKSTFQQMGPARQPVYSRTVMGLRPPMNVKNVYLDSPEYWRSLSWEGQFEHQERIHAELKAWWNHKEELRIKRELKEAAKQKNRGADL